MIRPAFSRRTLLQGLGVSAAALPLLNASAPRAAGLSGPKRFIVLLSPNGVLDDKWWPATPGSTFTFPVMTQSLEPYKADIIVMNGVQMRCFMDDKPRAFGSEAPSTGGSHDNYPAALTGRKLLRFAAFDKMADGPSIDQYIADGLVRNGVNTPFRSLTLGAKTQTGKSDQAIFRASDQPVTPENDPSKVYTQLFAGRTLDTSALDRLRADRKSILDFVGGELTTFGLRMGTEDRRKIDAHLQTVRDLERQLDTMTAAGCAPPAAGTIANAGAIFPDIIKSHIDLAVTAFACDLTRVVSLQMSDHGGTLVFDFLGGAFTQPSASGDFGRIHNTHEIAHHATEEPDLKIGVEQFFMSQVAYLLKALKAVPEGAGTMLDNTVVLYMNHAHNGGAHNSDNLPMLIAGGGGGQFKGGRYLKLANVPHNGVLAAVANAMDVTTATFGDPQYGGELPGLRAT
jgi:hypothetical protein